MAISLRYKLLLIVTALLLSTIATYLYSAINLFNEDKTAYVYENNAALIETLAAETETSLLSTAKTVQLIATGIGLGAGDSDDKRRLATSLFGEDDSMVEFALYEGDTDPRILLRLSNVDYLRPYGLDEQYLSRVQRERPVPFQVVRRQETFFQNSTLPGGAPLLTMALYIAARDGGPSRYAVVQLRQDRRIKSFARSQVYTSYLVDGYGNLLAHPDEARLTASENMAAAPHVRDILATQVATGAKEYDIAGREPIIAAHSRLAIGNLYVVSEVPRAKAFVASRRLAERSILFALLVFSLSLVVSIVFTKKLMASLRDLYLATQRIGRGEFDINLKIHSRDEVGALAVAFNRMASKILRLLEETAQTARMEKELETAQLVQDNFFPPSTVDMGNVEIASFYKPASECGGDWFSYLKIQDKVLVLIGDATGHGVPAALITAAAQSCCTTLARFAAQDGSFELTAADIMDKLNSVVFHAGRGKVKMTFFVAIVDTATGIVQYANAAHDLPIIGRLARDAEAPEHLTAEVDTMLGDSDPCLGQDPNATYRQHTQQLHPGDVVIWFTDGLIECRNGEGTEYGEQRLIRSFKKTLGESTTDVRDQILSNANKHFGTTPHDDDIALIVLKFKDQAQRLALTA